VNYVMCAIRNCFLKEGTEFADRDVTLTLLARYGVPNIEVLQIAEIMKHQKEGWEDNIIKILTPHAIKILERFLKETSLDTLLPHLYNKIVEVCEKRDPNTVAAVCTDLCNIYWDIQKLEKGGDTI